MPAQQVWVDGFIMQTHAVTNREYLAFLNDLHRSGRQEEAKEYAPKERASMELEEGAMIYGQNSDGTFFLTPDADGDMWEEGWPVLMVNWLCAQAYAEWYSTKPIPNGDCQPKSRWEKQPEGWMAGHLLGATPLKPLGHVQNTHTQLGHNCQTRQLSV